MDQSIVLKECGGVREVLVLVDPSSSVTSSIFVEGDVRKSISGKRISVGMRVSVSPDVEAEVVSMLCKPYRLCTEGEASEYVVVSILKASLGPEAALVPRVDEAAVERALVLDRLLSSESLVSAAASRGIVRLGIARSISILFLNSAARLWLSLNLARNLSFSELKNLVSSAASPYVVRRRFFRGRHYTFLNSTLIPRGDEDGVRRDLEDALSRYGNKAYYVISAALKLSRERGPFEFNDLVETLSSDYGVKMWPAYHLRYLESKHIVMTVYESNRYHTWIVPPEMWSTIESELKAWKSERSTATVTRIPEPLRSPEPKSSETKASARSEAAGSSRDLHSEIIEELLRLGSALGFRVEKEYPDPQKLYRYDVVWFKPLALVPCKVFEVQVHGDVDRALARLKHALDIWNRPDLFLVIADSRDLDRVKKLVNALLSGTFHEIRNYLTIATVDDIRTILQRASVIRKLVK
ncbi:MAG: hypothetical protein GXO32_05855 [Crenarchaeota archaeon]|nr:hypothetical protein [Thermoproteota archaeon]